MVDLEEERKCKKKEGKKNPKKNPHNQPLTWKTVKWDCFKEGRLLLFHVPQPKNKGTFQKTQIH